MDQQQPARPELRHLGVRHLLRQALRDVARTPHEVRAGADEHGVEFPPQSGLVPARSPEDVAVLETDDEHGVEADDGLVVGDRQER